MKADIGISLAVQWLELDHKEGCIEELMLFNCGTGEDL